MAKKIFNCIATADWHIDREYSHSRIDSNTGRDVRLDDLKNKIFSLVPLCKKEKIDAIFIAGDVFNRSNPDPVSLGIFIDFLSLCYTEKIHVFVIPGQHDIEGKVVSFQSLCRLKFWKEYIHLYIKPTTARLGGCNIRLLPFGCLDDYKGGDRSGKLADIDLVIMHGTPYMTKLNNFILKGDRRINKIAKRAKLSIVGDIHCPRAGMGRESYIVPGSLMRLSFKDADETHGVIKVIIEDGEPQEAEFLEFPDRDYITLVIAGVNSLRLIDPKKGDIIRVFISRDINAIQLREDILKKGVLSVDILYSEELLNEGLDIESRKLNLKSKEEVRVLLKQYIKKMGFTRNVYDVCRRGLKV